MKADRIIEVVVAECGAFVTEDEPMPPFLTAALVALYEVSEPMTHPRDTSDTCRALFSKRMAFRRALDAVTALLKEATYVDSRDGR